jgi:hypothetical protein
MVYNPPSWLPTLDDGDIPDDIPLCDFVFDDRYRHRKCDESPTPFVDYAEGTSYTVRETKQRIEWLAAGLAHHLGIGDVTGDVWDRVVSIFTVNNVSKE